jgi:hypothetical protein
MKKGDVVKIVKSCWLMVESATYSRGSTSFEVEKINLPEGTQLKYIGNRTPVGQSWGTVSFFVLAVGEIVECDVEGRLPERDIFAGAPPISDTQYYEVIGGNN